MIPYGRQDINEADIRSVVEVLRSDWLTQGPQVPVFEEEFAASCGADHAVAVSSATAALHLACLAMGLGPGKRLWTSPITFVASANAAIYCGADVDFVDIDPATRNMSIAALNEKLSHASKTGRLPHIVMPVHFAGHPCDMVALAGLSREYGFRILEDASHAVGSSLGSARTGDCCWSDAAVFSFHPVKVITSAEGGMVTTNDPLLAQQVTLLRSHGITKEAAEITQEPHGPWYYEQIELGFNYRMTDMQAALGRSQLRRLPEFLKRRRDIVAGYCRELAGVSDLALPVEVDNARSSWHLYTVLLTNAARRRDMFEHLRSCGLWVQVHYIPVHLQPYYRRRGFAPGMFPAAEDYYARTISLPLFPAMSDDDFTFCIDAVRRGFSDIVKIA